MYIDPHADLKAQAWGMMARFCLFLTQKPLISRALSRLELLNGSESIEGLLVGRECDFDSDRGLSQLVLGGVNHTAQKFSAD